MAAQPRFRVRFLWHVNWTACWIGVTWKTCRQYWSANDEAWTDSYRRDVWIGLVPCVQLQLTVWRDDAEKPTTDERYPCDPEYL